MQIDSKRIRSEREKRAWSQEHLAKVAGVALRTIQRVEAAGSSSYETAKSLASVFEMDVADLRMQPTESTRGQAWRARYAALAVSLVLAVSVFFARDAIAGQVMLDVGTNLNDRLLGLQQLITEEGKDAEIRFDGQMKMVLVPTVKSDGSIHLAIRLYEFVAGDFVLVSEPSLLASDNSAVEVRITSAAGNVFRISVKPHRI